MVTWLRARRARKYGHLSGFGPVSDGVPEPLGDKGRSEKLMPPPPKRSTAIVDFDNTVPMRKPCVTH